jgi:transposase
MRGRSNEQSSMLCLVSPESRVPANHPLREIRRLADEALDVLSADFDAMYAVSGRASVPPERLLKASLLIALYSIRSERQFCEQLEYNLLFRWFLDMDMMESAFDPTTFTKNRERLMDHDVAAAFFFAIREQASDLMSQEHFSVDGTLLEAWASMKSFRPKDDDEGDNNGWGDFRGKRRRNDTHESKTDPEARLFRKSRGQEAKLCYAGHALMENRHGLLMDLRISEANGYAERETALDMLLEHVDSRATLGADRAYDTRDFVAGCRAAGTTPHIAQYQHARRRSAIDGRTTRHVGYGISQRIRMRIETIFGWLKSVGGLRRTRYRGRRKTQFAAYLAGAAYNLMRVSRLRTCAL